MTNPLPERLESPEIERFSENLQPKPSETRAVVFQIDDRQHDQRLDNFLCRVCKGVPKSHIFRIIRSGEVRVNRLRAEAKTKLKSGDLVRIPPIKITSKQGDDVSSSSVFSKQQAGALGAGLPVLYEDEHLLLINKPSGMAVHGGSGQTVGVIEAIRASRAETHQDLELVHRIDRETSGVLVISKKRSALRALQEQLRARSWKKYYQALVIGKWPDALREVDLPLLKTHSSEKEARVFVDDSGDKALSRFRVLKIFQSVGSDSSEIFSLLRVQILTGRTHQIRVHTSAKGFPILGDDRYGHFEKNKRWARQGCRRMFLHAARLEFIHPSTGQSLVVEAPLPDDLEKFIKQFKVLASQ